MNATSLPRPLAVPFIALAALSMTSPMLPAQSPSTQPAAIRKEPLYPANSPETIDILSQVQKRLANTTSVEADFVQEKTLVMLKHKLTIKGRFATQKPDHVIWVVNEPVKYAIRVQGPEVRQWDEDTNKVQVINLGGDPTFKAISEQIQGWFLGDYSKLKGAYDVSILTKSPLSVRFTAISDNIVAKLMKDIEVTFNAEESNIDKMVVREAAGDETVLTFANTKLNQPIKASAWEIPPK